ncbi:MAG: WecB/TagA/CpsF family glycosyltransferase [Candidatus Doudnabacteria bacterium]
MKINVAGVNIDNVTKDEAISLIDNFVRSGYSHYVVTPYSEMIVFAQSDKKYKDALNNADLSLADGAGIVWAAKFLGSEIKERITGRKFVYEIAKLASENNYSLALVGGSDNVAAQSAYELKKLYPNIKIKLALSGRPFDASVLREINEANSDILLIAYSPPRQELWLSDNAKKLNSKVAIGLGGTFDYLSGIRSQPPGFMHHMGLEWLWRLITQPWRAKRIWNAVPVFIWKVYKYKLKHHG